MSNNRNTLIMTTTAEKNPRIPGVEFINDVEIYMKGKDPAQALGAIDERLQKYRFLEINLLQRRTRIRRQVPDFEKTLEALAMLEKKQEIRTHFLMSSQVYSKARIPPTDMVCLWLGANVMLEYPLDEARQLLDKNLSNSVNNLKQIEGDLEYLRDQVTTAEVNLARIYNWNVKRLYEERKAQANSGGGSKTDSGEAGEREAETSKVENPRSD